MRQTTSINMETRFFTEEEIQHIADEFPMIGENFDSYWWQIDKDANHWLSFDHPHNIVKIVHVAWIDGDFRDVNTIRVALTGDFEDDIRFGIYKVLRGD